VYQLSIQAACGLLWPADRIVIQVLDDSTDPFIKELVQMEVKRWSSKGINIRYEIRSNRNGYKAGALKQGMRHDYVHECDYVAIFDADFQPEPDFLHRTVPFLVHNPELALVQARWKFVNGEECLMTKMQEVSLNYHFSVEQRVGSAAYGFFGFNGTAGVWRIQAMNEAGGWNDRTTVEDMDLAVRASMQGWKFVYLHDLEVKNELPSTFKAFRFQQHRWSCGPASLFRKVFPQVLKNKKVKLWKKIHMLYAFFFVRKILGHIVTFVFYCVIIPLTVLVPEVEMPLWGAIYIPSLITLMNGVATPKSLHLLVFWVVFENVMSLHRTRATLSGLFDVGSRVNEWVVTEKLGNILKYKTSSKHSGKRSLQRFMSNLLLKSWKVSDRLNIWELWTSAFLLFCSIYDFHYKGKNRFYIYMFCQSVAFFIMGLGYCGTFVPS
jgi:beta-mannan synthase